MILFTAPRWNPDWLASFTWLKSAIVASAYSAVTLFAWTRYDRRRIFSKENARPVASVLLIHSQFMMGILIILLMISFVYSRIPDWLTDPRNGRHGTSTPLEIILIVVLTAAGLFERRLIYTPAESGPNDDASEVAAG